MKQGEATRRRLLETACVVFGEKGYRDATHAEICRRAKVNIAAINYHFGSKDALYRAAWDHASDLAQRLYPIDGGAPPDAAPRDRLRATVRALLLRRSDEKRLGHLNSIRMMEIFNPTGLLDEALAAWRARMRGHVQGILRDFLGSDASAQALELCELSVMAPCLMAFHPKRIGAGRRAWKFTLDDVDSLADHIVRFSCAGIRSVRQDLRACTTTKARRRAVERTK